MRFKKANGPVNRDNLIGLLWIVYNELVIYVFGALASQSLTDIAKYSIGRLRPHFIDVCKPRNLESLCSDPYAYIESFECTTNNKKLLKEMRLSFMSGHSSFSAYCMVYFAVSVRVSHEHIRDNDIAFSRFISRNALNGAHVEWPVRFFKLWPFTCRFGPDSVVSRTTNITGAMYSSDCCKAPLSLC